MDSEIGGRKVPAVLGVWPILEFILHFIADTGTHEIYSGICFSVADVDAAVLCSL